MMYHLICGIMIVSKKNKEEQRRTKIKLNGSRGRWAFIMQRNEE